MEKGGQKSPLAGREKNLGIRNNNVEPLTKGLIYYLEVSDQDFKGDLTAKICSIVEKLSPDKLWYIDQMLKVLYEAGNYVKDEVWHALVVITNASNLHGYTVWSLYRAIQTSIDQEAVVRVGVWCIGEYGDLLVTENDAVDVIELAINRHTSDLTTRSMCLIALLKLSSRFPSCSYAASSLLILLLGLREINAANIYVNTVRDSAKLRIVNRDVKIQALIDGKKIIVNEASIRRDLKLEDAEGSPCLPNATIFEELTRMGYEKRKEAEVAHDETKHEDSVPTPSNDPLPSGEDSMQLNDLMVLCTKLQKQVLDLEKAKSDQAIKIASLKKRVEKLEMRRRSIRDIDADVGVTLVNETQERHDEDLMFDSGVLDDNEMFVDAKIGEKDEQSTKIDDSCIQQRRCSCKTTTNTLSNIKLPVLQKDDYDTWAMEMEHYLEYIDNEVWKVIQNGNSKKRVTKGKDGVYRVLPPTTQEEQVADEKERKARTLLLMAVPKDHLRQQTAEMRNSIISRMAFTVNKRGKFARVNSTTGEAVTTAGVEDNDVPTIPTTVEETLAQNLMEIKAAKPNAKGIVFHDLESRPLTKKDQVALDEDLARNIQAQLDAKIIEEERLERQKQEEANIALIESRENT
ncbi:adaptor protein complex AP-1, gamma subunit [Tanacetum coccineum]